MTHLSSHRFRSNEVRLLLSVMAYNLGNLWRRLVAGEMFVEWFLDSPAERQLRLAGAKTTREKRMQVAGSKDGGWVYTAHDSGVQNGNPV